MYRAQYVTKKKSFFSRNNQEPHQGRTESKFKQENTTNRPKSIIKHSKTHPKTYKQHNNQSERATGKLTARRIVVFVFGCVVCPLVSPSFALAGFIVIFFSFDV